MIIVILNILIFIIGCFCGFMFRIPAGTMPKDKGPDSWDKLDKYEHTFNKEIIAKSDDELKKIMKDVMLSPWQLAVKMESFNVLPKDLSYYYSMLVTREFLRRGLTL